MYPLSMNVVSSGQGMVLPQEDPGSGRPRRTTEREDHRILRTGVASASYCFCERNSRGSSYQKKLTVWCALWAGGIIGPYFFKNDEGHNVTVNGDWYRAMITNFFIPELNNHDVQELWFQQDGAACQTARTTIDL
ncbi:hypothetical protein TNCV_3873641 [Trichonephila clavipes]|nr:hypothetical protein TNCV_3873641 [Trichonephila clavipes]